MLQDHSINKYSIQFIASPGVKKEVIYTTIAREKEKLLEIVNEIFTNYFPEDSWIEIDQIQLDIGTLSIADFPDIFNTRVKTLLIEEIEKLLEKKEFQDYLQVKRNQLALDPFQLLERYLEHGFNPVLQQDKFFDPDTFLLKLLEQDPARLASLLHKNAPLAKIRKRLKQFNPETLLRIEDILPGFRSNEWEENDRGSEDSKAFDMVVYYFRKGTFSKEAGVLSRSDVDLIVGKLSDRNRRKLAAFFLKHASDTSFMYRFSESLRYKTLYSCFEGMDAITPVLKEWNSMETFFEKEGYNLSSFPSYRLFFLEFIQLPLSSGETMARLIYNYLNNNNFPVTGWEKISFIFNAAREKELRMSQPSWLEHLGKKVVEEATAVKSIELEDDLEVLVYYFRSGILKGKETVFSDLVSRQLEIAPFALSASIQEVWKEEGVRYRIAYQMDIPALEKLLYSIWGSHYTYPWWIEIVKRISEGTLQRHSENQLRSLYFLYFEFLARYNLEQFTKGKFEEWLTITLKYSVSDKEAKHNSEKGVVTNTDQFSADLLGMESWTEFTSLGLSKEQSLQHRTNKIFFLSKYGSIEEVQLFFEYYLEEGNVFRELFTGTIIPYSTWAKLWVCLSHSQLERMLAVAATAQYQYLNELIEELKELSSSANLSAPFEFIRRRFLLIALQILHGKKDRVSNETLARQLMEKIFEEEYSLYLFLENNTGFFNTPILSKALTKIRDGLKEYSLNDRNDERVAISYKEFSSVVQSRFPDISGFMLIYLSALEQFFRIRTTYAGNLPDQLYLYIYNYLLNHQHTFSAASFVRTINTQVAILYHFEPKELGVRLLEISEDNIQQGKPGFYGLKEILASQQSESDQRTQDLELPKEIVLSEIKENIIQEHRRTKAEFFRTIVADYLYKGIIPGKAEGGFESEALFFEFIKEFEHDHSVLFFSQMKELLSNETVLESFLNRQKKEAETFILQLLSGNRYEEFVHWRQEVESFLLWSQPDVLPTVVSFHLQKSLLILLLLKERSTVGLFSYVEQVIESLKDQQVRIITKDFRLIVEKYKAEGRGSSLFVKLLEQMKEIPEPDFSGIRENLVPEAHREKTEFFRKTMAGYLSQGIIPGKAEGGFESKELFFEFIRAFERDHAILFFSQMKELLSKKIIVESFLSRTDKKVEAFFLQLLSGNRYEEFVRWRQEVESFLLWAQPEVRRVVVAFHLQKSLLNLLLHKERGAVGLFSYVEQVIESLKDQQILIITGDFQWIVKRYKAEGRGSVLLLNVLEQIEDPSSLTKKAGILKKRIIYDKSSFSTARAVDQALEELFSLVQHNSEEEIQLFFEYYLEEGDAFRALFVNKPVPYAFWLRLATVLSDSLLDRLLVVLTTFQSSYFNELLKELKIMSVRNGRSGVEPVVKKSYALLFQTVHEMGYSTSKERIAQRLLTSLFSSEGNDLSSILKKNIKQTPAYLQKEYPLLYAFIEGFEESSQKDRNVELLPVDEIKRRIQDRFSTISEFVFAYLSVVEEYLSENSNYYGSLSGNTIYDRAYDYLVKNSAAFSMKAFVQEFTIQLAIAQSFYLKEVGASLLTIAERKIAKGDSRQVVLREILGSEYVVDRRDGDRSKEFTYRDYLSPTISFLEFNKIIQDIFPAIAGFVSTYLLAVEQSSFSSIKRQDILSENLYVTIYDYLLKNKEVFSANSFVREMNRFISVQYRIEMKVIEESLAAFSEEKESQGLSRFAALLQIIGSQRPQNKEFLQETVPVSEPAEEEYQRSKEELIKYQRKIKFDFFRKAFTHYLYQGTFPDHGEDGFRSMEDFKIFLRVFYEENKGKLLPVLKEILSRETALEHLFKRTDAEINSYILQELSGERYSEFIQWNTEIENFLYWSYPGVERTILTLSTRKSLLRLLLLKDCITVGLFSYLELALEDLKLQKLIVVTANFPLLLERYKAEGKGGSLFVKALERVEFLLARKERDLFLKDIIVKKNNDKAEEVMLEGRLRINNAGIVLIGPFLYRYFDRLAMLENQKFKTEELACRAVQLLQYMATGSTEMQEHELLLNKILCGVKLDCPIDRSFSITDEEKEVSESLLKGLLANWDKLKSSSIDSLREGFLMREGYIEQTELSWNLEIARKAIDILVDFIPWSFSLIKLSWMELSLATKWKKSLGE